MNPGKRYVKIIYKKIIAIPMIPANTVSFKACSPNCAPTDVEYNSVMCTGNEPELIISASLCASSTVKSPSICTLVVFNVLDTAGAEIYFGSAFPTSSKNASSPSSKSIQMTSRFCPVPIFLIVVVTSANFSASFNCNVTIG